MQDEEHVQFWTEDWNVSREIVLQAMIRFLVPALLPGKPDMFYRSKWTGFEKSVSYFGLLAMSHNLLKATILQYLDGDSAISSSVGQAAEAGSSRALQDAPDGQEPVEPEAMLEQQMNTVTSDFDWTAFKQQMKETASMGADESGWCAFGDVHRNFCYSALVASYAAHGLHPVAKG